MTLKEGDNDPEKGLTSQNVRTRTQKRKSPSTLKRNAKRREEFLVKKSTSEPSVLTGLESNQNQCEAFQCGQCNSSFKTVNGLKIHKGKSHKEAFSPEVFWKFYSLHQTLKGPAQLSIRYLWGATRSPIVQWRSSRVDPCTRSPPVSIRVSPAHH